MSSGGTDLRQNEVGPRGRVQFRPHRQSRQGGVPSPAIQNRRATESVLLNEIPTETRPPCGLERLLRGSCLRFGRLSPIRPAMKGRGADGGEALPRLRAAADRSDHPRFSNKRHLRVPCNAPRPSRRSYAHFPSSSPIDRRP